MLKNTLEIMETLGCRCNYDSERELANISAESIFGSTIEPEMMNRMRSSILFLGSSSVSNRRGRRWLSRGWELGARPIDLHLKAFLESWEYR